MYCADVENCDASKGFGFIYIYRLQGNSLGHDYEARPLTIITQFSHLLSIPYWGKKSWNSTNLLNVLEGYYIKIGQFHIKKVLP